MAAWNGGPQAKPGPSKEEAMLEEKMSKMAENIRRTSMALFALGVLGFLSILAYMAISSGGWLGFALVVSFALIVVGGIGSEVAIGMEKKQ